VNEFQLIQQYFNASNLAFDQDNVVKGIGDDCCILKLEDNQQFVMSLDTLVEDVHFPKHASAFDIATRALSVSLSDLAAMGASPVAFTLGITLPNADETWIKEFCEGLSAVAMEFNMPLIGGDTTKGPCLVLSLQVHGVVEQGKALTRSGAKVGHNVYVSGPMGDGAGALPFALDSTKIFEPGGYFHQAFYRPLAQVEFGKSISAYASSCLDVSDGLLQDAGHICQASHLAMNIQSDLIPLSAELLEEHGAEKSLTYALTGGDDYQLLYTAQHCEKGICIGEVKEGDGVYLDGEILSKSQRIKQAGFQHFN